MARVISPHLSLIEIFSCFLFTCCFILNPSLSKLPGNDFISEDATEWEIAVYRFAMCVKSLSLFMLVSTQAVLGGSNMKFNYLNFMNKGSTNTDYTNYRNTGFGVSSLARGLAELIREFFYKKRWLLICLIFIYPASRILYLRDEKTRDNVFSAEFAYINFQMDLITISKYLFWIPNEIQLFNKHKGKSSNIRNSDFISLENSNSYGKKILDNYRVSAITENMEYINLINLLQFILSFLFFALFKPYNRLINIAIGVLFLVFGLGQYLAEQTLNNHELLLENFQNNSIDTIWKNINYNYKFLANFTNYDGSIWTYVGIYAILDAITDIVYSSHLDSEFNSSKSVIGHSTENVPQVKLVRVITNKELQQTTSYKLKAKKNKILEKKDRVLRSIILLAVLFAAFCIFFLFSTSTPIFSFGSVITLLLASVIIVFTIILSLVFSNKQMDLTLIISGERNVFRATAKAVSAISSIDTELDLYPQLDFISICIILFDRKIKKIIREETKRKIVASYFQRSEMWTGIIIFSRLLSTMVLGYNKNIDNDYTKLVNFFGIFGNNKTTNVAKISTIVILLGIVITFLSFIITLLICFVSCLISRLFLRCKKGNVIAKTFGI